MVVIVIHTISSHVSSSTLVKRNKNLRLSWKSWSNWL